MHISKKGSAYDESWISMLSDGNFSKQLLSLLSESFH